MQSGDLNKVWEIRALKRRQRHDEAKQILERIAKQVQPIMRKHNWRVKVLSEMHPKRRQLLGLNVGAGIEVKLRLCRPDRVLEFLPFDQVLDTMLHKLCHNAHGPHNASFWKLWDQLRKERDLIFPVDDWVVSHSSHLFPPFAKLHLLLKKMDNGLIPFYRLDL